MSWTLKTGQGRHKDGRFAEMPEVPVDAPTPAPILPDDFLSPTTGGPKSITDTYETFRQLKAEGLDMTGSTYALPAEGEPPRVLILRGIPGSGKSTFAKTIVQTHQPGAVVRLNNDDLATMLFGTPWGASGNQGAAALLAEARETMLATALRQPSTRLVIVDNTNLSLRTVNGLARVAMRQGATVQVDDRFLSVPEAECVRRDALRTTPVGASVIGKMARQAARLRPWTAPSPEMPTVTPYPNNNLALPETIIVDVDGTLAVMTDRSPYEWDKVGQDVPNMPVVSFVRSLLADGKHVTVMSGRDGVCREKTQAWLDTHVAPGLTLHMRTAGDQRKDAFVKHELFQAHIADQYRVGLVLDDRDQVVRVWRALGLPTWQVAEGDF